MKAEGILHKSYAQIFNIRRILEEILWLEVWGATGTFAPPKSGMLCPSPLLKIPENP